MFLHVINDPHGFIKLRQLLRKKANAHGLPNRQRTGCRLQPACQYVEQRRFADAVFTDNADAVMFDNMIGHMLKQRLSLRIGKGNVIYIQYCFSQPDRRIKHLYFMQRLACFNGA